MKKDYQTRNAKHGLMSDARFDVGDVLAIHRGGARHVVLEVRRPDWEWLQGALLFVRLSKVPPGVPPWPDDVYEHDPVVVVGRVTDPDLNDKLRPYGAKWEAERG